MKQFSALLLSIVVIVYLSINSVFASFNDHGKPIKKTCLISTHWKQMGGFQKFTPDHMRLGCWSTAIAQIVYYHHLKPFGPITYISKNGYHINDYMDSAKVDWKLFANRIDSTTSAAAIDQMARYNYNAALVVMKDFGRDSYMNKLAPASLFESHYRVKASRYISWHQFAPYTYHKLKRIIETEINADRPLMLHFANLKDFGHSVVIDGYERSGNTLKVHLNQGQGGPDDGWYDFDRGILRQDDVKLRVIYTFRKV